MVGDEKVVKINEGGELCHRRFHCFDDTFACIVALIG